MKKDIFIKLSCSISSNIIDWIRSVYFSLFGASMLTFTLKYATFDKLGTFYYLVSVFCFFCGLYVSLTIANRFKNHEKLYDTKSLEYRKSNSLSDYYLQKETEKHKSSFFNRLMHFCFHVIWLPAIIFMFLAGLNIEEKSSLKSKQLTNKIDKIYDISVNSKNLNLKIDSLKENNKLLIKSNIRLQEKNDSLKKVLKKKGF